MGIGDFLFGGSSDVKNKQMSLWNPEQQNLFSNFLMPLLQGNQLTSGPSGGPYGASLTALEQWAQNVYGGGVTEGGQVGQQGLIDLMKMGPQDISDYYTQTVERPMLESFQENVLPGINRTYAPSGFWSSQRVSADQRAREDLLDSLTQARSSMAYQARESDLNRMLGAGGTLMQGEQGARSDLLNLLSQGTQQQQFRTSAMLQALGLRPYENVSTVTPGSTGLLQGMLSPAMQGLGTGMGYAAGGSALDWLKQLFG